MLLAPRKLVTVTEFKEQEFIDMGKGVRDDVSITFYGKKRFFFWTYLGETTNKYKFNRVHTGKNVYAKSEPYKELIKQLRDNFSNQTSFLSSDDYDFFREEFPERFI